MWLYLQNMMDDCAGYRNNLFAFARHLKPSDQIQHYIYHCFRCSFQFSFWLCLFFNARTPQSFSAPWRHLWDVDFLNDRYIYPKHIFMVLVFDLQQKVRTVTSAFRFPLQKRCNDHDIEVSAVRKMSASFSYCGGGEFFGIVNFMIYCWELHYCCMKNHGEMFGVCVTLFYMDTTWMAFGLWLLTLIPAHPFPMSMPVPQQLFVRVIISCNKRLLRWWGRRNFLTWWTTASHPFFVRNPAASFLLPGVVGIVLFYFCFLAWLLVVCRFDNIEGLGTDVASCYILLWRVQESRGGRDMYHDSRSMIPAEFVVRLVLMLTKA